MSCLIIEIRKNMFKSSGSEKPCVPDEEVEAFFSTDGVNKRRIAFRARIEHVHKALQRRIKEISAEHVGLVERFATGGSNSAGLGSDDEYGGVRDVVREITVSGLVDSVAEAFTALLAFTPDIDPAETWEREVLLKRLSMLREQVRMLKAELRQQQARYNTLAGSHSSLLHFTNALRTSLWSSVNAIASELRAQNNQNGALQVLAAFHREWPSDVTSQATLLEQLQTINDRGNRTLEYSEEADDAVKELVANAVAEARGEERAKTRAIEEQLHDLEASLPTRIAEAVRLAKDSMKNNAALFERLKGEYEQRIDELSDLVETMKTEANRRVDDVRNVVMKFTKASVGIDVGRKLASARAGDDERYLAESILKQEELKMELLRQKVENKVEQQTLHRTLKAANQRLAKIRPEQEVFLEAQEPLKKEINNLKLEVLSWNERAAALSRELQRQQDLLETTRSDHRKELQQMELLNTKPGRRESVVGGNGSTAGGAGGKPSIGFSHSLETTGNARITNGEPQRQRTAMFVLSAESDAVANGESTSAFVEVAGIGGDKDVVGGYPVATVTETAGQNNEKRSPENIDVANSAPNLQDENMPIDVKLDENGPANQAFDCETAIVSITRPTVETATCDATIESKAENSVSQASQLPRSSTSTQLQRRNNSLSAKPAAAPPVRGKSVLDAMVSAAVEASVVSGVLGGMSSGITTTSPKVPQQALKQSQNVDAWKPMDLVKVLLAAAAAQMVQRSLNMTSTVLLPSHAAVHMRTASTQTPVARHVPKPIPDAVDKGLEPHAKTLRLQQSTSPRLPSRPVSAIHSFPRTVPSVQRVHRRSASDLSLVPEAMIISKKL
jgi:hypothetical protein